MSLKVEKEHCNLYGTLHGGLSAVLVDTISTLALITDDEKSTAKLGVSVDMHMRYFIMQLQVTRVFSTEFHTCFHFSV